MGGSEDEAVAGAGLIPMMHFLSDAFGGAAEAGEFADGAAAADADEIGEGGVLLARACDDTVTDGLKALDNGQFLIGEGLIHSLGGEVIIQHLR